MRIGIFLVIFFIGFTLSGFSQDKFLTIEDAVVGEHRALSPQNLINLQWRGNNKSVVYQDYYAIYERLIDNNKEKSLVDITDINLSLSKLNTDTLSFIPLIAFINSDVFSFTSNHTWYCYSVSKKNIICKIILPNGATNIEYFSPQFKLAYTLNNNIYIADITNNHIKITDNNNTDMVLGESVSRNEFGIEKGLFWSPSGNKIAYYRKDNSKVLDYPLVDINTREAEVHLIKYPMAGMASEHISLGIYNFEDKRTSFIERDDTVSEKYLTNIAWSPDNNSIYIQVLNREQNLMQLNQYNADSGSLVKTLFTENHDKYVEPEHPILFIPGKKGKKFIYQTRHDGYNHAYLYNTNGELIQQITSGDWEIKQVLGLDAKYLYYTSTKQSPIETHVYKTDISNGKTQQLTTKTGTHQPIFNSDYNYFIDDFSSIDIPRILQVIDDNGTLKTTLLRAENPLKNYNVPKAEVGTIKSDDGVTDLYYRLIKPVNFDSTKSYPAIIYVYGGPHLQLITNEWNAGARLWQYYMSEKGYVMLTVDNRGSANRGLEFENVIFRQCGVAEMKDQMKGVEFLKSQTYVDANRIGVHGWSFGGFMTTTLMLNYPDVFKVGVAGGPVIDWKYYEVMYGERYMDTPDENPNGYAFTSLLPRTRNLKGKLLIIHGALDSTVVMQQSQLFVNECINNNVPIDYFIYPRAEHNVRGLNRIHLMQKVSSYFDDYLK